MNYAYNIKINLKKDLINFYEWDNLDKIKILKKVPLHKINNKIYNDIINNVIIVNNNFLKELDENNICIFCTELDTICIKFNKNGKTDKISKLDLVDERDILDSSIKNKINNFKYKITNTKINYSYNTRNENKIKKYLIKYIENEKNNKELIEYLYYEWFNKEKHEKDTYQKLINSVYEKYNEKHNKLYKIVELIKQ